MYAILRPQLIRNGWRKFLATLSFSFFKRKLENFGNFYQFYWKFSGIQIKKIQNYKYSKITVLNFEKIRLFNS